jgi:hypothetical protein
MTNVKQVYYSYSAMAVQKPFYEDDSLIQNGRVGGPPHLPLYVHASVPDQEMAVPRLKPASNILFYLASTHETRNS